MTQIDPTSAASIFSAQPGGLTESSLGKEDFLNLLVAQLKNQDPLNPSDPTEFTAQLAQFSSLEQLFTVNENLGSLSGMSGDMQRLSALGMIGQEVVAEGTEFQLGTGPVSFAYQLDQTAASVNLHILDSVGSTVATLTGTERLAGEHQLTWDGTMDSGGPALPGQYFLAPVARDLGDNLLNVNTLISGVVDGVDFSDGQIQVHTSSGIFPVGKIQSAGVSL